MRSSRPELQVIAPWREWQFKGREDLIAYVKAKGVPVQATVEKPYSTDRNLWHCSHEGGILEDPAREPPDHIFVMTKDPLERSEEHTSELQSPCNLVCRLLLEKKKKLYVCYST